jgi:hypothetical protein
MVENFWRIILKKITVILLISFLLTILNVKAENTFKEAYQQIDLNQKCDQMHIKVSFLIFTSSCSLIDYNLIPFISEKDKSSKEPKKEEFKKEKPFLKELKKEFTAFFISSACGVAKEGYDYFYGNTGFSTKDIMLNTFGNMIGLFVRMTFYYVSGFF